MQGKRHGSFKAKNFQYSQWGEKYGSPWTMAEEGTQGHVTRTGKPWNQVQVMRVLERAAQRYTRVSAGRFEGLWR
jgi:hypothetical protein